MVQWLTLRSLKQLHGFLGLTRYYRRFIKGYASIAAPLTNLLCKDAFIWTPRAESSFQRLKQAMVNVLVLRLPNFDQDFCIETDASNASIGAMLMQDGHPLSYFSRKLGPRMQSASTYIKELHAIVEAVRKWRQYLLGCFFIIRTDQCIIKELLQQVIQTPNQQKDVCKLLKYDFKIEYKPRKTNLVANALSRVYEDTKDTTAHSHTCLLLATHPIWEF